MKYFCCINCKEFDDFNSKITHDICESCKSSNNYITKSIIGIRAKDVRELTVNLELIEIYERILFAAKNYEYVIHKDGISDPAIKKLVEFGYNVKSITGGFGDVTNEISWDK